MVSSPGSTNSELAPGPSSSGSTAPNARQTRAASTRLSKSQPAEASPTHSDEEEEYDDDGDGSMSVSGRKGSVVSNDMDADGQSTVASRRTSSRLASKHTTTAARALATKAAPTPTTVRGRKPKSAAAIAAATPPAGSPVSREGTPAPLSASGTLSQLAEVATKVGRPRGSTAGASSSKAGRTAAPSGPSVRDMLSSIEATGTADVVEVLVTDPNDKLVGFKQLEDWIDGGLDMYRHEFRPLLFPIFCHFYLELVQQGFKDSAIRFYELHAPPIRERHAQDLHELSTLLLPQHVLSSPLAQRFRSEKYIIRMSRAGFALLVGWLTEGIGGEAMGAGEGLYGTKEGAGRRARMAVLTVINSRLRFEVTASSTITASKSWEENTGLLASLIPENTPTTTAGASSSTKADPSVFNAQQGPLKLGPPPLLEGLKDETERIIKEEMSDDFSNAMAVDGKESSGKPGDPDAAQSILADPTKVGLGLVSPEYSELPPQPPTFRSVDLKREVHKVRDTRKRIKLDPTLLNPVASSSSNESRGVNGMVKEEDEDIGMNGFGEKDSKDKSGSRSAKVLAAALPSICAYTYHDATDGVNCSTFSEDSTLMAAGFGESYIRVWSLKKEKLKGLRSDFHPNQISDASSLKQYREKNGSSTRKLIGHSAPVFSVAFDPIGGTGSAPKYLLSASADHTTRLWSMETLTNVVAYRGHANPIWDVQWSPLGTYFATGSRDRTARLWSTERVNALRVYAGHLSDVDVVRFHPNSLYLATGSSDSTCRLWDVQKGSAMRVFIGHQGAITAMAMSPDGRYLASAATDQNINLWDLGSGRKIKTMLGHTGPINSLSFSSCSTMIVSGGSDWTVRCWDVKGPGGVRTKPLRGSNGKEEGALPEGGLDDDDDDSKAQTVDLVATFPTKRTPIINVQMTARNLCLVSGPYVPPVQPSGR